MAQLKYCPFEINSTIELKNIIATSDNNGIQRTMYPLTSVPVLWDIGAIFFSSIVILITKDNFWVVPLLHSVSNAFWVLSVRAPRWRDRVFHSGIWYLVTGQLVLDVSKKCSALIFTVPWWMGISFISTGIKLLAQASARGLHPYLAVPLHSSAHQ